MMKSLDVNRDTKYRMEKGVVTVMLVFGRCRRLVAVTIDVSVGIGNDMMIVLMP